MVILILLINKKKCLEWMLVFLGGNPDLSIRKSEATSGARAVSFSKVAVSQLYKLLQEVEKYTLTSKNL